MRYQESPPHPELRPYISCYSILSAAFNGNEQGTTFRFPSDGGTELMFNLGTPLAAGINDESLHCAAETVLLGPLSRNLTIQPQGETIVVTVRFLPGGLRPLFHVPVLELTNRNIDLDTVSGPIARELTERINESNDSHDFSGIVRLLDHFFLKRMESIRFEDTSIRAALKVMAERDGQVVLEEIVHQLCLSRRQFERRFISSVGISPKRFCRIKRFAGVMKYHYAFPGHDWAETAAACGYSDQSHLIRECRFFTGRSPVIYFSTLSPMEKVLLGLQKVPMSQLFNTPPEHPATLLPEHDWSSPAI